MNKSIFTVQQHYHKQETTILNDIDSMILNLLSLHNHVGDGKFFTPPWSPVTPPSGTQGGVTCPLPPPLPTPLIQVLIFIYPILSSFDFSPYLFKKIYIFTYMQYLFHRRNSHTVSYFPDISCVYALKRY